MNCGSVPPDVATVDIIWMIESLLIVEEACNTYPARWELMSKNMTACEHILHARCVLPWPHWVLTPNRRESLMEALLQSFSVTWKG